MTNYEQKLRITLKINAAFSLLSGIDFIVFNGFLADKIGVDSKQALIFIGVGLIVFAGLVFFNAFRKNIDAKSIKSIIVQDLLWVIASAIVLTFKAFDLSALGYELILLIALIVGTFAIFQMHLCRQK